MGQYIENYAYSRSKVSGMYFPLSNVVTLTSLTLQALFFNTASIILLKVMFVLNFRSVPTGVPWEKNVFHILKFQLIFLGQTQAGSHLAFNDVCVIHNTSFH